MSSPHGSGAQCRIRDMFHVVPDASETRSSLGIPEDTLVFGHVSRLDPVKDPSTLFRGYSLYIEQAGDRDSMMLVVGGSREAWLQQAKEAAIQAGISERVIFMGPRSRRAPE